MFGSKKKHGTVVAVFDISSSSVGGAHALFATAGNRTILASTRIDAALQDAINAKRSIDETAKNIVSVIEQLQRADIHHPDYIQLVLAAPWYVSQTRSISYKKDTAFICTKKLISDLVADEVEHIIKNEFAWFGASGKEGIVVEKQISQIKLNGYSTSAPYGKGATTLELFLTVTVVPKKVIDRFSDSLRRHYGTRTIGITTSPYATFVMTRDYFNAKDDAVIIDVGEEVTDIAFVKNGLFLSQHSFPVGTYALYRTIVTKAGATIAEAKALLETYRLGKSSATAKAKIQKSLSAYAQQWQEGLQKILSEGQYGFCLPEHCYITADPHFEGVFPTIVKNDAFMQHRCVSGAVQPQFINAEIFSHSLKSLDKEIDASVASGVLYSARIL